MSKVVQLCGTSGSGKSHIVRTLLSEALSRQPEYIVGRKLPLGYLIHLPDVRGKIYVVGSYEAPTGGCDTINEKGGMDLIDSIVQREWGAGRHVIFEGLMVRNFNRGLPLLQMVGDDLRIFLLTTPLEQCYAAIRARRAARGIVKENPKNTVSDMQSHETYARKMEAAGARVLRVSRAEVLEAARAALRGE